MVVESADGGLFKAGRTAVFQRRVAERRFILSWICDRATSLKVPALLHAAVDKLPIENVADGRMQRCWRWPSAGLQGW